LDGRPGDSRSSERCWMTFDAKLSASSAKLDHLPDASQTAVGVDDQL
jgi:hypothetical protein